MFKFLRVKRDRSTAKRARLPKECFGLKETLTHGFPYHPTCLAYDSKLGLLALGTQQGSLRVYGKPGVELIANEDPDCEIVNIVFIEGRGQIVVHCHDNSLSLWEINVQKSENGSERSFLERVKTCHHFRKEKQEGRSYDNSERSNLKQITSLCVDSTCEILLVGMQGGNISIISLETFDLKPEIIYQDVVIQNMPDSLKKTNPGAVETIVGKPHDPDRVLIGYTRGLLVLWNKKTSTAEHFYNAEQQLESVCWLINGEEFISSHNDGSYIQWKIDDQSPSKERQIKEYGPFPCKPIHKIVAQTTNQKEEYLIFEGGLSRSDHRDKNAVTILKKGPDTESKKHHTLDLSARVIDFIVIPASKNEDEKYDSPEALIVLTEEEIVAIDLLSPEWLQYPLPYLSCIHSSPITYAHFYSDTPADVYEKIEAAGIKQSDGKYSTREWPIQGGNPLPIGFTETKDLLITGHEDGSVRFWAAGGVNLKHLYTLETSRLFNDDIPDIDAEILPNEDLKDTEDQWPFFRKVGSYDPFADDLRLQIQRFVFSALSSTLVVAGSAGQVIIFTLTDDENFSASMRVENLNLISGNETFTWKGEPKLKLRPEKAKFVNFEPLALIQTNPPSNITSLAWHSEWKLLAIGNAYGFGLYDFVQHSVVVAKCTLNPRDSEALAEGDALISRRKSFKKSLRESIRRLRRVRSTRDTKKSGSSSPTPTSTPTKGVGGDRGRHTRSPTKDLDSETKPVERRIEARQTDEISGPVVRYLYIGLCGIDKKDTTQTPTLWAGTHAGMVYALAFNIPGVTSPQTSAPPSPLPPSPSSTEGAAESGDKSVDVANDDANDHQTTEQPRKSEKITFLHGREMRLAHKAPVIFIQLLDSTGYPQPDPLEVKHGRTRAALQADKVLVCTEEQFILYTLPQLKHHSKFKLTAAEGLKARKIAFSQFAFDTEEVPPEQCLVVLSNSGEVEVFSSELEQRLKCSCISNEDRHGISHLIFTAQAEGLYLHSPSEYKRFSLSTKRLVEAISLVRLPDGARPQKAVEVPPVTSEENALKDVQNGDKADDKQVLKETVEAHDMPVSSPTSETNFCADETDRMNDTFIGSSQDMNESERDDIKDLDISKINLNGSADVTLDSSMFTHPPSPNQTNDGDLEKNGVLTPITGELIEGDNKAVSGGQKKIDKEENEVVNRSVHIASH